MLFKKYPIFFLLSILLLSSFFLTACGNPIALSPPRYGQVKLKATTHWDDLANQVAEKVAYAYGERKDIYSIPLYVSRKNDLPFSIAFQNLLKTHLVSRALPVSEEPIQGGVTLDFDAQVILFGSSHTSLIPNLADLGIAVATVFTGIASSPSRRELVLNSRLSYQGQYIIHVSSISYINDDEWALYTTEASSAESNKLIPVKDR